MPAIEITHNPAEQRWEARADGALIGLADYVVQGRSVVFHHTEVDPDRQGHGVAGALAQASLDAVREAGQYDVVPQCSFYRDWIGRHPAYADLVHQPAPRHEENR